MKNLSRKVCCILSNDGEPHLNDIVYSLKTPKINSRLKKENDALKIALKTSELPKLIVSSVNVFEESEITEKTSVDEVRFVIHNASVQPNGKDVCEVNSHVIEITTASTDDLEGTEFDYKHCACGESFVELIVDVMLDIQMFHFFGLDVIYDSIAEKKAFSKKKVAFVEGLGIADGCLCSSVSYRYCSFAFFCHNKNGVFDFRKYIGMWENFVVTLREEDDFSVEENAVDFILAHHRFAPQLSRHRLTYLLETCKTGEVYELVHIYRKPKSKHIKKRLGALFGESKTKVGAIKIVPMRSKYQYVKYSRYVDIFEFIA